jgi:phage terminase large subunit
MSEKPRQLILPHNWNPRPDQMPMWSYLENGGRRADMVAHRRWGKDDVSLHWAAVGAHQKIGTYWHMLPEAAQARKAIWDAINPRTGKRRIDEAFPKELRQTTREQDMLIRFKCGSTWQVLGSDNYDSLVGSPPIGVVFSEWGLARPDAWNYIRPILLENGGWAVFIWTPRGRNHATRAFEAREKDATWFTCRMPATLTPVFTAEQLAKEKQDLIDEAGSVAEGEAKFQSEYMVDFDSAVPGSYYAKEMLEAQTAGRICEIEYDPRYPVDTSWDLGIDDYTAIWFFQRVQAMDGNGKPYTRYNVLDFYETSDLGLDAIVEQAFEPWKIKDEEARVKLLENRWWKKKCKYGMHYLPHDVAVRELGASGRSRRETLHKLGIRPIRVGVARDPEDRINAVRRMLPYCFFHAENCTTGTDHLKQYRKRWNQSMGVFTGPLHNEHSHAADGIGEMAVNARLPKVAKDETPKNPSDRWAKRSKSMLRDRSAPAWKVA